MYLAVVVREVMYLVANMALALTQRCLLMSQQERCVLVIE